ncbi:hypothetical protein [Jatrophihabitans sp.]|uniref:hypothetical protein n=1 Tax=Jatrophihabitans sp. TaxID=1932789 RepID=UPI002CE26043|nr:hypothetical protein [Jatrophihabitans sp.]
MADPGSPDRGTKALGDDSVAKLADAVKQLLTLASAALTLSVVFFKDVAGGHVSQSVRRDMRISWVLMLVSIVAGLAALFTIVNSNTVRGGVLRGCAFVQQLAFVLSFAGFVGAAWVSIK